MPKTENTVQSPACTRTIHKCVEAVTPISIDVSTRMGDTEITCGEPVICHCSRPKFCRHSRCDFTVHQTLMVEIPISYDVHVDVGETGSQCETMK